MNRSIDTLTIQRFRGLSELALEGLGSVNILVGDNNSGKTSILEGISIYSAPMDPYAWRTVARRRVRGFEALSTVEGVKWLFPQGQQATSDDAALFSGEIALKGQGRTGARALRVLAQEIEEVVEPREEGAPRGAAEPFLARGIDLTSELTLGAGGEQPRLFSTVLSQKMQLRDVVRSARDRSTAERTEILSAIISPFDHGLEELYKHRFRRAVLGDQKAQVIDALRRIDPGIQDMEFLPGPMSTRGGGLYLRHTQSGRTPLSAFGDGVRRALLMALTLVSVSGGHLLIDEIETAIHVSVLGGMFKWLVDSCREYDVQLFATTHSLEALDAILSAGQGHLDSIVGYRFPSLDHPGTVKRYEGEQLTRLRFDRGLDVR